MNALDLISLANRKCTEYFETNFSEEHVSVYSTERLNLIDKPNQPNYLKDFPKHKRREPIIPFNDLPKDVYNIWSLFNYIEMSDKKIDDHKLSYIIPNGIFDYDSIDEYLEEDFSELNLNIDVLNEFFEFLIKKAKSLVYLDSANDPQNIDAIKRLCRFIIFGPPGIGKTAIINYLISVNFPYLLDQKVMWIRVDLNKPEGADLDLKNKFNAKFLRIFSKYYLYKYDEFNLSFLKDIAKVLSDFICRRHESKYRGYLIGHVTKLINLMETLKDADVRRIDYYLPKDFHRIDYYNEIIDKLISYIQDQLKYSFIFIYDGLDSVTIDYTQFAIFEKWLEQIVFIADNDNKPYRAVYLLTMRDYSLIDLNRETYYRKRTEPVKYLLSFKELPLKQINMNEVLYSKLKLIMKHNKLNETDANNIKYNLINLLYMSFYYITPSEVLNIPLDEKELFIRNVFSFNHRKLMRFLRELILNIYSIIEEKSYYLLISDYSKQDFLKEFHGKEYKISRMFLFGDQGNRPYQNKIQYYAGELIFSTTKSDIIPNIFNYFDKINYEFTPFFPKNLIKLRIIQYLIKNNGKCSMYELLNWLQKLYYGNKEYPKETKKLIHNILRHETREMFHTGVLYPHIDESSLMLTETQEGDYSISLMPLGETIKNTIITKSIYYEIIVDDTPLDQKYLRKINYTMSALNRFDKRSDLGDYIKIKTKNIVLLLQYLYKIENAEKLLFKINLGIDNKAYLNNNFLIFSDSVKGEILKDMAKYLAGYIDSRTVTEKETYISNWGKYFNAIH